MDNSKIVNTQTQNQNSHSEYGYFDVVTNEYVITNVITPRPWVNVLSNGRYGAIVSQSGGGFSWIDNCQFYRLTRWDQDLVADSQGRFVYFQLLDDPERIYTVSFHPTSTDSRSTTVRHGMGYSIFQQQFEQFNSKMTVFVDPEENLEYWLVELSNTSENPITIRVTSAIDWLLGSHSDWHREFHRLFIETKTENATQYAWKHTGLKENSRDIERLPFVAFHTVSGGSFAGFNSDKAAFFAHLSTPQKPAALTDSKFNSGTGRWDDPMASASTNVELQPGTSTTVVYALGAGSDADDAKRLARLVTEVTARRSLENVVKRWEETLSQTEIESDDPIADNLLNRWFKYQAISCRIMARCAYYQQGGAYGYRDQLQDSLLYLHSEPSKTLQQIHLHAEAMYEDGGVRHWWHPGFPIYVESHHSDTCLWLAYALLAYLDETNDLAALDQNLRYLNRKSQDFGTDSGTLWDHAHRGIMRALGKLSPRGLPLIGAGDWNDGLSHVGIEGRGESVWMAMFLFDILKRWEPILTEQGNPELAAFFATSAEHLRLAVEEHAWDGEWYIAGTRDDGTPFGSAQNAEGKIFLNTQTWAVISGIASPERQKICMSSARKHLFKKYGALLLAPAYSSVDPNIGYITRYAPGLRENGGVYSHAATWAIIALSMQGEHAEAASMLRSLLPNKSVELAKSYAAEPYVMPGNIDGPDSPFEGHAGWTWYTGSAAWMVRAAIDWVYGVRATRAGLTFQNSAASLGNFTIRRAFRGDTFIVHRGATDKELGNVTIENEFVHGPINGDGRGKKIHVERR